MDQFKLGAPDIMKVNFIDSLLNSNGSLFNTHSIHFIHSQQQQKNTLFGSDPGTSLATLEGWFLYSYKIFFGHRIYKVVLYFDYLNPNMF
jgi:hypothetical protein